jgi:hypothetical protein
MAAARPTFHDFESDWDLMHDEGQYILYRLFSGNYKSNPKALQPSNHVSLYGKAGKQVAVLWSLISNQLAALRSPSLTLPCLLQSYN